MNDEAWKLFVELAEQAGAETERALEQTFKSYEHRIESLETENAELRRQLAVYENTTLADLVA